MKDELRYKYKVKRKYFQHSAREVAEGAIADVVLQSFEDKQSFFVYRSFGSEADTTAVISRLLALGKRVYLPRVEGRDMVPVPYFSDTSLQKGAFGVLQPCGQAYDGGIEVCITPLLAVNKKGYRLGYGGGYYDRYFALNPQILKVGIGFSFQITEEEFEEEGDVPLDMFISERGIYTFGK